VAGQKHALTRLLLLHFSCFVTVSDTSVGCSGSCGSCGSCGSSFGSSGFFGCGGTCCGGTCCGDGGSCLMVAVAWLVIVKEEV
jgi:hypothetical protein